MGQPSTEYLYAHSNHLHLGAASYMLSSHDYTKAAGGFWASLGGRISSSPQSALGAPLCQGDDKIDLFPSSLR